MKGEREKRKRREREERKEKEKENDSRALLGKLILITVTGVPPPEN